MKTKRINLDGIDRSLEIGKVVHLDTPEDKEMFAIEKMKDGRYRILASKSLIPDFRDLKGLTIIRPEGENNE